MIINSQFLLMECDVINSVIDTCDIYKNVLLQQYNSVVKCTRCFDPCGFYTNFEVDRDLCEAISDSLTLSIYGILNDERVKVDFILFVRNGYISTLECCKIFEDDFPEEIISYVLCKDLSNIED